MKNILSVMLALSVASSTYPIQFPNVKKYLIPLAQMTAGAGALGFACWQAYKHGSSTITEIMSEMAQPVGHSIIRIGNMHISSSSGTVSGLTMDGKTKTIRLSNNKGPISIQLGNMRLTTLEKGSGASKQFIISCGGETKYLSDNSTDFIGGHKVTIENGVSTISYERDPHYIPQLDQQKNRSENSISLLSNIISHPLFIAGLGVAGFAFLGYGYKNLKKAYRSSN